MRVVGDVPSTSSTSSSGGGGGTAAPAKQNYQVNGKTYSATSQAAANQAAAADLGVTVPGASTVSPAATPRYPSSGDTTTTSPADSAESTYQSDSAAEPEGDIASRVASEYSGEISSIQNYYNTLISQATTANTEASGKERATESAEGELGSPIGNTAEQAQDNANLENSESVVAAENNAEGAVEGQEASQTESEITAERGQQQTADQNAVTYAQDKATQTQTQIATVAGTTALSDLPQDEYDALYEASGFTTPQQFNDYYQAMATAAKTGAKTIGDATTGVWQQQADGTWKSVIPAPLKTGSLGANGGYVFDPNSGQVTTVSPTTPKIVSSGGIIYAIDPSTNEATPLTSKTGGSKGSGWDGTGTGTDQEKAGIMSYLSSLGSTIDMQATLKKIESDPDTYYQALGAASQNGYYTNVNVGTGDGSSGTTQDATDALTNDALSNDSGDASGGS